MIGFLAFLLPIALFLGIPSAMWNFDGVACAIALELGRTPYLFHSNHLLYGFLGYLFWKFLCLPAGIVRALPALQLFSSLLSALGLVGLYRLLDSLLEDARVALLLTLTLSVTAAFWVWSIEAQVYPLGFLPLAWATAILVRDPGQGKYVKVGLLHGLAVLGHLMHFLWAIPALYWMRRDPAGNRKALGQYAGSLAAATLLPYAIVILAVVLPARASTHLSLWLKGSAGLSAGRRWAWHFAGWSGPWIWLKSTLPSLWGSFWPYGQAPVALWAWILMAVSILIFFVFFVRGSTHAKSDRTVGFSWLWLGVYGLFLSTWEPGTLCYRMTDVIPLGIVLASGLKTFRTASRFALLGALLVATAAVNLATRIVPMHQAERNPAYQQTLDLSKTTSPDSLYVAENSLSWIYLLYFTGRTAWNAHSFEPGRLAQELDQQKRSRPVYVQSGSAWRQIP